MTKGKLRNRLRNLAMAAMASGSVLLLFAFFYLYPQLYQFRYMIHELHPLEKVIQKWGEKPFDPIAFRAGTLSVRAPMAADVVRNQLYVGQSIDKVHSELGRGDLYPAVPEFIPAYILEQPKENWKQSARYYLDFDYDEDTRVITSVLVMQYCCENPYAAYWYSKGFLSVD